jgi:succinyl-CoA synthetase beta subunit
VDLYEHMGKDLFARYGITVPSGVVATDAGTAAKVTRDLGGTSVVKAQVQVGGRGKGGGVVLADSPVDAAKAAERMLAEGFQGMPVTRVLVEERLAIAKELYTAMLLDRSTGKYLAMMTAEGGIDIEELARTRPDALRKVRIDPILGLHAYHVRELVSTLPLDAREGAADVLRAMYALLVDRDATLVEVNPLVLLEDGRVVALDAKVTIDDNALWRHPDLEELRAQFPIDEVERRAKEKDLQYVKLDGDVGIIGNGAGLVMATLDVVAQAGARAANFLDVGGGASADQMATSLEVVLSDPAVKVVLVNIFGGITRCDLVAQGILEALERIEARVPIVVRLDGTNAEDGRRILTEASHPRIVPATNMLEAAEEAADLAESAA